MKKYEPILDREGHTLFSSDEVAMLALPYRVSNWEPTGIALRTSTGTIHDVRGLDLERGLVIAHDYKHDLSTGGF